MHRELVQQQQAHVKEISKKNEIISTKDRQIEELEQMIKVEEEESESKAAGSAAATSSGNYTEE